MDDARKLLRERIEKVIIVLDHFTVFKYPQYSPTYQQVSLVALNAWKQLLRDVDALLAAPTEQQSVVEEVIDACLACCDPGSATDDISDAFHRGHMRGKLDVAVAIRSLDRTRFGGGK